MLALQALQPQGDEQTCRNSLILDGTPKLIVSCPQTWKQRFHQAKRLSVLSPPMALATAVQFPFPASSGQFLNSARRGLDKKTQGRVRRLSVSGALWELEATVLV